MDTERARQVASKRQIEPGSRYRQIVPRTLEGMTNIGDRSKMILGEPNKGTDLDDDCIFLRE